MFSASPVTATAVENRTVTVKDNNSSKACKVNIKNASVSLIK
jgi:hypothetical protein